MRNLTPLLLIFLSTWVRAADPVPAEFQDLYPVLQSDLDTFLQTLTSHWDGTKRLNKFSTDLLNANSNSAAALLQAGQLTAVDLELKALAQMHINTVIIAIHAPIFYQPFFDWLKTQPGFTGITYGAQDFIDFYKQVAARARLRGMKVGVESHILFVSGTANTWPMPQYYATLDFATYQTIRSSTIVTVAQQIRPDYLSIQAEPDTEATQSGFSQINTISDDTAMIARFLNDLDAANAANPFGLHSSVLTAAGVGTWILPGSAQLILNEAQMPNLDIIDMHIYPIKKYTNDYLANAVWIADHANGKKISMTEAWLYKERYSELFIDPSIIYARDVYSFWAPLDQEFIQIMVNLGHWKGLEFISMFWDRYFFAYLNYDQAQIQCPPGPSQPLCLSLAANQAAAANMIQNPAVLSTTGIAYSQMIQSSLPQPPQTPRGFRIR